MNFIANLKNHPDWVAAENVCQVLVSNGYKAYLAGGVVRDAIMGRIPHDIDIATDAAPEVVEALFSNTVAIGKKFGIITVVEGKSTIEVARFRSDGNYRDGRHPESIQFASAKEDADRRDFTINGLFFDISENKIIDYVDGQKDIEQKIIRAIGKPELRFAEDHLRILRAIRFAAQLGFVIEKQTWLAIVASSQSLLKVSAERIYQEIEKLLLSKDPILGLKLLLESKIFEGLFCCPPCVISEHYLYQITKLFEKRVSSLEEAMFFMFFPLVNNRDFNLKTCLTTALKASNKVQKFVTDAFWYYQKRLEHFAAREGQFICLLSEPSFVVAMDAALKLGWLANSEQEKYLKFAAKYQKLLINGKLPQAWVSGVDLQHLFSGVELGNAIKKSYWLQLEGTVKSKEDLIAFWEKGG